MSEQTKIDKEYLKAFNLGYELAKELNLKTQILETKNVELNTSDGFQMGIQEYLKEKGIGVSKKTNLESSFEKNQKGKSL